MSIVRDLIVEEPTAVGNSDEATTDMLPTFNNYKRQGGFFTDFFDPGMQAAYDKKYEMWRQDTAYQRKVQDLIKAGLNPVLAAGGQGSESAFASHSTQSNIGDMAKMSPVVADLILRTKQVIANVHETEARTKQIKALTHQIEEGENLPPRNLLSGVIKDVQDAIEVGDVPTRSFNHKSNFGKNLLDKFVYFLLSNLN